MTRFQDAVVGDKVYCRKKGPGTIYRIDNDKLYPLIVDFSSGLKVRYTLEGKILQDDHEAMLFYRDNTSNYLEERPGLKASMLPIDTKLILEMTSLKASILPTDTKLILEINSFIFTRYHFAGFEDGKPHVWNGSKTSFSASRKIPIHYPAYLGGDLEIDGVKYLKGTRIGVQ